MKTYYLVDYENLHEKALSLTQKAAATDEILLFYTLNSPKIDLKYLKNQKAKIEYFEVKAGKQSLDMSLSSYLGYLIKSFGNKSKYVIVSGDTGYDNVIHFWKTQNTTGVSRQEVSDKKKETTTKANNNSENDKTILNNKIAKKLKGNGLNGNTIGDISSLVVKHYNEKNRKYAIYLAIIKKYGQKDGLNYYNLIKKEL